jgi:hypothetical protein
MRKFTSILLLVLFLTPVTSFGAEQTKAPGEKQKYFKVKVHADGKEEAPVEINFPVIEGGDVADMKSTSLAVSSAEKNQTKNSKKDR